MPRAKSGTSAGDPQLTKRQQRILENKLKELESIEIELQRRENMKNPMFYGLPDLLFPIGFKQGKLNRIGEVDREPLPSPETNEEYERRQELAIKYFVETELHFLKEGRRIDVKFIDTQIKFIADLLYGRVSQAILWKSRGGGGSLCAAILIWLSLLYKHMSFVDLGGSMEQSRVVYEYVSEFWNCFPDLKTGLLEKDPLLSMTKLVTGVQLRCIPASERMARGKHLPGLVADEACQDDVHADTTFTAAMNITMSEPTHTIVLLSTFHIPVGLFQQVWDNADVKGFTRYKWDVFDVMQKCEVGLESATPEDPDADAFCKEQCPLTIKETVVDEDNNTVGHRYIGCNGKARRSCGFLPRENVINALVMNEGSEVFWVEYACLRPRFSGPIYGLEAIENTIISELKIDDTDRTIVGIDWGVTEGVLVLGKDSPVYGPQIIATKYLSVKLTSEYIKTLDEWKAEYGELDIYADAAGQFNIGDLEEAGYLVTPVDFGSMKDYGIANLTKLFMYGKIQILDDNTRLIEQLKSYRRDPKTGKPLKIDDHGPDALLCATIEIDFLERWSELMLARSRGLANRVPVDNNVANTDTSEVEVEEKAIDRDNGVMLF